MYVHAQAPCRIGVAGGGTDLPAWTREHVGYCLSLAIRTYTHAVAITRPDGQVVASYRHLDTASYATEIGNGLVRESALMHGWESGFEVHTLSEVSSQGSGLGVSSSIAVALAAAFSRMSNLRDRVVADPKWCDGGEPAHRARVARDAWRVEIEELRRPVGRQDHMAAAHGGLRLYRFEGDDASVERSFSDKEAAWVAQHLILLKLPGGHDARTILSGVALEQLHDARAAVDVGVGAIESMNVERLGRALDLGQASKRGIPGASTVEVEDVLKRLAARRGVYGCKVAGAGGGGHIVVACDPNAAEEIGAVAALPILRVEADFSGVRSEGWP